MFKGCKMKIALIGTHGTGKTTLAHELTTELKKEGLNTEFLGELARECPLPINEKTTKESQEWIIFTQHLREIEMQNKYEILICDRSILDGYVYYIRKFGREKTLEEFIKKRIKDYDLIVKIPINESFLREDGIRSINKEFQEDIDKIFEEILEELEIPFITHERTSKTKEIILNLTKNPINL